VDKKYLFIRIRQCARSSRVKLSHFGSPPHLVYELALFKEIAQGSKLTIFSNSPFSHKDLDVLIEFKKLDLATFVSQSGLAALLFDGNPTSLSNVSFDSIILIRDEGDFYAGGEKIECDCNSCLLQNLFPQFKKKYTFEKISPIHYENGIQYTYIVYSQLTSLKPSVCANILASKIIKSSTSSFTKNKAEVYEQLGSPRYIAAPMVDETELAFRMMTRKYGAQLCYTNMILSDVFVMNEDYRKQNMETCEEDRPLVMQFAANNPSILLKACEYVIDQAVAIDINLGCPQPIAKRHCYGAWLMENWPLLRNLISTLNKELPLPIWCKIRIFIDNSIEYAKMLEDSGCSLLTVHGRTRDMNNQFRANWETIKKIKEALHIPVIANGDIRNKEDVEECLKFTGCNGVMSGEGLLSNPTLYSDAKISAKNIALEYLNFAQKYNAHIRFIRPHTLQILNAYLTPKFIELVQKANQIEEVLNAIHTPKSLTLDPHALTDNFELLLAANAYLGEDHQNI